MAGSRTSCKLAKPVHWLSSKLMGSASPVDSSAVKVYQLASAKIATKWVYKKRGKKRNIVFVI